MPRERELEGSVRDCDALETLTDKLRRGGSTRCTIRVAMFVGLLVSLFVLTSAIGRGACGRFGAWVLVLLQGAAARCVAVCALDAPGCCCEMSSVYV